MFVRKADRTRGRTPETLVDIGGCAAKFGLAERTNQIGWCRAGPGNLASGVILWRIEALRLIGHQGRMKTTGTGRRVDGNHPTHGASYVALHRARSG